MSKLQVLQPVGVPKGTPAFEEKREKVIAELNASIPEAFHLPESFFQNPPLNVTSVPSTCGILSPAEIIITEHYDASGLAEAIAQKQFSAVAVATAFCKRAAIAHQLTCCLTQYFMDEAIERAKYLDEYLEKNGKTVGPLHGVPVSVKEHMAVAGHWSSFGYFSTRKLDDKDSLMIQTLRAAGAVFYVKTNQPQGIMHLESDGWIGRVNNPYNINLSSGGSTGGESALIALKASPLGLGTGRSSPHYERVLLCWLLTSPSSRYRRLRSRPLGLLWYFRLQAHLLHHHNERLPARRISRRAQRALLDRPHGPFSSRRRTIHESDGRQQTVPPRPTYYPHSMDRSPDTTIQ